MLGFSAPLKIWLATEPVDFRKGIDGLCGIVRERFGQNPLHGGVFVFISRSYQSIRLLFYDCQGFWLCQKRLSQGRFHRWPRMRRGGKIHSSAILPLVEAELGVLLRGGEFQHLGLKPDFRQIQTKNP